jgi:hypothetical protein
MKTKDTHPQIFISYARIDAGRAEQIYQYLSESGYKPWMDTKDILPGELWLNSIHTAIENSDFFLACLSNYSVDKRGILQREIKAALDVWDGMLEGDIYLIPVRLDNCAVPNRLSAFQWVDLYEEDGWEKLRNALLEGLKRRSEPKKNPDPSDPTPINSNKGSRGKGWLFDIRRYRFFLWIMSIVLALLFLPLIYNNNFYRVPSPVVPIEICQASSTPLEIGVARFTGCELAFNASLAESWKSSILNNTTITENITTSSTARSYGSNLDIVVWGECVEDDSSAVKMHFELMTSSKPFEIFEPLELVVTGKPNDLALLGLAIFYYRYGDYSKAHSLFASTSLTVSSPDLMLLKANSSLYDLQSSPAITEFKEITQTYPVSSAAAYNNMGVAISGEDRNQALGWFNQAVALAVDEAQNDIQALARVNRSQMYLLENKWPEAKEDCDQAGLLDRKTAIPYLCLAKYKFSFYRFGAPWSPFPFKDINRDLIEAENFDDVPPFVYYLRADWYRSHFWKNKQAIVDAYARYLSEMEYKACLPSDRERNAYVRDFLDELTLGSK